MLVEEAPKLSPSARSRSGLTPRESHFLRSLTPPARLQRYLDDLGYDVAGSGCRSPRRVLEERVVQCLDGAIFAAAALREQGHRPLLLDFEAIMDVDHVVALYRIDGCWGSLARSNYSGLRFREPIFRSVRELALSYFESYFNLRRQKTLRRYSAPFDLSRFDGRGWETSEEDLWWIAEHLVTARHYPIVTPKQASRLATVDRRMFAAGLVGLAKKKT
jgi:hypothetical protein